MSKTPVLSSREKCAKTVMWSIQMMNCVYRAKEIVMFTPVYMYVVTTPTTSREQMMGLATMDVALSMMAGQHNFGIAVVLKIHRLLGAL